ncbi:hypothetical protein BC832DRAFT_217058 [Gaertneriomyces semiglobifer]|nr:hypothetical protein BC832DRAFT_217058 [Gaertneriomyces semiglobifer]
MSPSLNLCGILLLVSRSLSVVPVSFARADSARKLTALRPSRGNGSPTTTISPLKSSPMHTLTKHPPTNGSHAYNRRYQQGYGHLLKRCGSYLACSYIPLVTPQFYLP